MGCFTWPRAAHGGRFPFKRVCAAIMQAPVHATCALTSQVVSPPGDFAVNVLWPPGSWSPRRVLKTPLFFSSFALIPSSSSLLFISWFFPSCSLVLSVPLPLVFLSLWLLSLFLSWPNSSTLPFLPFCLSPSSLSLHPAVAHRGSRVANQGSRFEDRDWKSQVKRIASREEDQGSWAENREARIEYRAESPSGIQKFRESMIKIRGLGRESRIEANRIARIYEGRGSRIMCEGLRIEDPKSPEPRIENRRSGIQKSRESSRGSRIEGQGSRFI